MSQENSLVQTARRKRVQTLKKVIVLTLFTFLLVPIILCVVLFWKVHVLEQNLVQVSHKLDAVIMLLEEQEGWAESRIIKEDNLKEQEEDAKEEQGTVQTAAAQTKLEMDGGMLQEAEEEHKSSVSDGDALEEEQWSHKVYLTFDDGPSIYTDEILEILERYDVKATFFVLGKEEEASKDAIRKIAEKGHTLGMHSYSHVYRDIYRSVEDFAEDFHKIQDYLYDLTGVKSTVYRFPGGSSNTISKVDIREFGEYLKSQGTDYFDWNISSGDGGGGHLSVHTLVNNSTANIERFDTSVILLHDAASRRTTVEALPMIIENILALEDTVILPITEDTELIQHIQINVNE